MQLLYIIEMPKLRYCCLICRIIIIFFYKKLHFSRVNKGKMALQPLHHRDRLPCAGHHHFVTLLFIELTPCGWPVNQDKVFSLEPWCHIMRSSGCICLSLFRIDAKTLKMALKMPDIETFWVQIDLIKLVP